MVQDSRLLSCKNDVIQNNYDCSAFRRGCKLVSVGENVINLDIDLIH